MDPVIIALVALAIAFSFLNGVQDSSNIVATAISSRALPPRAALAIIAVSEFAGPFLFGVAVAETIGSNIVSADQITISVVLAAMLAAIIWNITTWFFGIPSSSSHALIGGIVGAVMLSGDWSLLRLDGILKILTALFISPVIGFIAGFFFMKLTLFLARSATPGINVFFKRVQLFTAVALGLSHGANDAQKTMGVIVLGLMITGQLDEFVVPTWVVLVCAAALSAGGATGGWRLIRTLGGKFYKVRPIHGFNNQLASAAVTVGAALLGGPVSTTQVVSTALLGVGAAERPNKVRWGVAGNILTAWLLTIPLTGILGLLFNLALSQIPSLNQTLATLR